jgi:hypothetical protein
LKKKNGVSGGINVFKTKTGGLIMPGFDGTGPAGFGPMTGGGRGFCVEPGWRGYPRYGRGGGYGRGWRHRFWATGIPGRGWWRAPYGYPDLTPQEESEWLKQEAAGLEKELEAVRQQLEELKGKYPESKEKK